MKLRDYCNEYKRGSCLSGVEARVIGKSFKQICKTGWKAGAVGDIELTPGQVEEMLQRLTARRARKRREKKARNPQAHELRVAHDVDQALIAADKTKVKNKKRLKVTKIGGLNPNSDEFLYSYEWRTLRMQAINLYGARCQCCGHTAATSGEPINVDHIKPRRLYPELALTLDNLQILCGPCNQGKGNWDMTDWRVAHASA